MMDIGEHKHNYEGFCKMFAYSISINEGRPTNLRCPCKPSENSLLFSLSLLVKSMEEKIQLFGLVWILIKVKHLNSFENSFK